MIFFPFFDTGQFLDCECEGIISPDHHCVWVGREVRHSVSFEVTHLHERLVHCTVPLTKPTVMSENLLEGSLSAHFGDSLNR
jgi:hypothetical protein